MNARSLIQEQAEWWYELHNPSFEEWRAFIEGQANAALVCGLAKLVEMVEYTGDMLDWFDKQEGNNAG